MSFIQQYFTAERMESMVFFALGQVIIVVAIWFYFFKDDALLRGAAWPLALVALIQMGVGMSIFFRSPQDMARVENFVKVEPNRLQAEEIPRMEKVMQQFTVIKYIELALFALAIGCVFFMKEHPFWRGVGIGLTVQSVLMLCADYFAEARGHVYLAALKNWTSNQ
jgi:hypothetical protein